RSGPAQPSRNRRRARWRRGHQLWRAPASRAPVLPSGSPTARVRLRTGRPPAPPPTILASSYRHDAWQVSVGHQGLLEIAHAPTLRIRRAGRGVRHGVLVRTDFLEQVEPRPPGAIEGRQQADTAGGGFDLDL